ncbi:MAG: 1-acyl-sn-glycerol-3-phosphate acyltransferase [Deltaproteobacteria bacterium]|nr:1-acyl-sn-glycerol-3-phosphate acyltransferase [Deltaproteobacteria bacterium]
MPENESSYPFILDHKPRIFLNWLLYRLFKRVQFNETMRENLKQMHRDGTVVYAIKYRGHLDYLMYHYRFRKSRLPYPKIAFDLNMSLVLPLGHLFKVLRFYISSLLKHHRLPDPYESGFYEDAVLQGTSSLVCLVDPKGFTRRYIHSEKDPLQLLLETQNKTDKPIFMVPQLVLYKKTPEKEHPGLLDIFFGFKDKPGVLRKIILFFRHNRRAFIDFGEPVDLRGFLGSRSEGRSLEEQAGELRHMLLESIDRQKRVILGPVIKSRQQFKEKVLKDPTVVHTIETRASKKKIRPRQVRKEAARYFDEIAADYNVTYIQFANIVLTWLWKKIFQGIDVKPEELAKVRECSRKGPVVYLPSHKSHIDYLILNHILYQHHMHVPRIAAGRNLNFWPVGPFFRKSGAFFIRRTFKGAALYAAVFMRYVKALLEESHPLEFFIEGGRSRSGKLVLPKIGFLSILVQAFREGYCDDLVFVPASITYDRVLEERAYLKELGGEQKKDENIRQVVRTRRFLKKKYGRVYIRFGEPVLLREYLAEQDEEPSGTIHKRLAFDLIRSINRVSLVTPMALLATAILTRHRRGFTLPELTETAGILLSFLKRYGFSTATSLGEYQKALEKSMDVLIKGNVVNSLEDAEGMETFYYVDAEKMRELEYYKNSIIHCFLSHAFVALSLLKGNEEVKGEEGILKDYDFLKGLFRYEFIYEEERSSLEEIHEAVSCFSDFSYIAWDEAGSGYRITRLGFDRLPTWAALIKTFLESYWIAARSIIAKGIGRGKQTELLKNMNNLGLRYHKLGFVEHLEAVSQLNFKNAIRVINEDILTGARKSEEDATQAALRLSEFSQQLHDLSNYRK